jgi:hypothetical protein
MILGGFDSALAATSRATYGVGVRHFMTFHAERAPFLEPYQACQIVFIFFAAWLASKPSIKAFGTIKVYLFGVRAAFLDAGLPSPIEGAFLLERYLRGLKRIMKPPPKTPKQPITARVLRRILHVTPPNSWNNVMFRHMCILAYFGFLRQAEFTAKSITAKVFPRCSHVAVHQADPTLRTLNLPASKADVFRLGVAVKFAPTGLPLLDPVNVIDEHMQLLATAKLDSPTDPLFRDSLTGKAFSRERFTAMLKTALRRAHYPANTLTGHSFRRGAATDLHEAGVPDSDIKVLGRWASWCFVRYISMSTSKFTTLSRAMARLPSMLRL